MQKSLKKKESVSSINFLSKKVRNIFRARDPQIFLEDGIQKGLQNHTE